VSLESLVVGGMPVQAIRAAAAMSFWWLVRHTG
jgi:hypothetical protein